MVLIYADDYKEKFNTLNGYVEILLSQILVDKNGANLSQ